jgi:hypothetical protein
VDYAKPVRDALREGGCWFERRGKGDHDIRFSPHTRCKVTVDGKIKSRHSANEIMKRAGLEHRVPLTSVCDPSRKPLRTARVDTLGRGP